MADSTRLKDLGEFQLIKKFAQQTPSASGITGIGDDCAVFPAEVLGFSGTGSGLLTTDTMVDEIHFRRDYTSPFDLGWKLLAVNLSDIAAMGGTPEMALLTLQLPADIEVAWAEEVYRGIVTLALLHNVKIVGGDTTGSTVCALGITAIGHCAGAPIFRSGAKEGDDIWVSGNIGSAGAGLMIFQNKFLAGSGENVERLKSCYLKPRPRLSLGQELHKTKLAKSMIDISDGLFQDLGHVLARSGVRAEIYPQNFPLDLELAGKVSALQAAVLGDDYELLFTAAPDDRKNIERLGGSGKSCGVSRIGKILLPAEAQETIELVDEAGKRRSLTLSMKEAGLVSGSGGYQHFLSHDSRRD